MVHLGLETVLDVRARCADLITAMGVDFAAHCFFSLGAMSLVVA